jgi:DNA-binding GntR family transcriptional regulator
MSRTGLTPIAQEKESLVDRVFDAVRQSIIAGRLRAGEALSISDLAGDLGVSHSPVREALQRLAGQGLVELRPARSAIVAPLDVEDLTEIYRIRELLEVDAAARACPDLEPEDIAELEGQLRYLADTSPRTDEFWIHHDRFHRALMRPALSPRLDRITKENWSAAERYVRIVYADSEPFESRSPEDRHRPLLEAAKARNAPGMRKALGQHLKKNEEEMTAQVRRILERSK